MIGIHPELSNEEYHAHNSISRSGIMCFDESPQKYWANYLNPDRPVKSTTPAMMIGSAFHSFVLEPEKFYEEYVLEPTVDKLPKVGLLKDLGRVEYDNQKAEREKMEIINNKILEEFREKSIGRIVLNNSEWDLLKSMKSALEKHPEAWGLIEGAVYEQSYFWEDKDTGLTIKARPDILHKHIIVDLKTCMSASSRAFQRTMIDSGYFIQGAMIREAVRVLEGRDIPNIINICIEKTYPWSIGIKIISEKALDEGERKFKSILKKMKLAIDSNDFPSYEIETICLPPWYNVTI